MTRQHPIGYALSSEEHPPTALVRLAQRAEQVGFDFALISDHFHPWTDAQGQSPFVWCTLGGIAHATTTLHVGTGVTCPILRIHPAIIAQAAATAAAMLPGRFFLGVGTGENLNEHVLGDGWPDPSARLEMLDEAIEIIRLLWQGRSVTHRGGYYAVDQARLYTLPDTPPPIYVAADAPRAAQLAGAVGDGLIGVSPQRTLLEQFVRGGGEHKPRFGQVTVCYAPDEAEARRTALRFWPNAGLQGVLPWELKTPALIEQAAATVRKEDLTDTVICGPDPERHRTGIRRYLEAGYDHIYVHQIGPDQEGFFRFYAEHVLNKI